ncbi:TPA: hypothetical protein NVH30_003680 [Vibrio cholerae]|nr:hypothetical protein [Vibrio cholerae]HCJ7281261.1 hypothetical protein [Vibrio cholerae]HCJ7319033.1 hypothetical protein [Vibrio cholerae]
MKNLKDALLVVFLFLFSVTFAHAGEVYEMNKQCVTDGDLYITKIVNEDDETIVYMEYRASKSQGLGLYPAGHQKAFYITDVRKAQKYHLLESSGLPIRPGNKKIKRGDIVPFKLVFERIPMKRFHMTEGVAEFETSNPWHFTNIKLK